MAALSSRNLFIFLCLILIAKVAFVMWMVAWAGIGLAPDEAQYWTWSQQLDWGYYSKPPGIAWQIGLGTHLFGNTEFGVRFGSCLIGVLLPLAVFLLAQSCKLKTVTCFWSALTMAFCPLGLMASFLATTDGGFVLFWTLACAVIVMGIHAKKQPYWLLLGVLILCGALFKWPIYLLWLAALASLLFFRPYDRFSFYKFFFGITISLVGLLPSIIWNKTHDWATFRHVWATIHGGSSIQAQAKPLFSGNFPEFFGAQAGLLSPLLFILLICAFIMMFRNRLRMPSGVLFCGSLSLAILLCYAVLAFFQKMQGNWCAFAYPSAIVLLAWFLCEHLKSGLIWLKVGLGISIVLFAFVLSVPYIQSHSLLKKYPISYKLNLFHHNIGWDELEKALTEVGYNPEHEFLFADKYQMSSILSFYSPEQHRAYFLNLHQARRNQFSYWPGMQVEQMGQTGYFVWVENSPRLEKNALKQIEHYQELLEPYFEKVRFVSLRPLFYSNEKMAKGALIFKCENYNGLETKETSLY